MATQARKRAEVTVEDATEARRRRCRAGIEACGRAKDPTPQARALREHVYGTRAETMKDGRYAACVCPGCGWTGQRRPLEDGEDSADESFCQACGYTVGVEPFRLPSIDELVNGRAGRPWQDVDLARFVPALLKAIGVGLDSAVEALIRAGADPPEDSKWFSAGLACNLLGVSRGAVEMSLPAVRPTADQIAALRAERISPPSRRYAVAQDETVYIITEAEAFMVPGPRESWRSFDVGTEQGRAMLDAAERLRSAQDRIQAAIADYQPVPPGAVEARVTALAELHALFEGLPS